MFDLYYTRYGGARGPVRSLFLFLFHLAWKSRIRLPVLIAIGLMVLDLRMQLEINIDLGRGGRQGMQNVGQGNDQPGEMNLEDLDSEGELTVEDDSDSYTTDSNYTLNSDSHVEDGEDEETDNVKLPSAEGNEEGNQFEGR